MDLIWEGIADAFALLVHFDRPVMQAAARSVWISGLAVTLAALAGVPAGIVLARASFVGRRGIVLVCRAAMSMPTVFVGLVCFAALHRRGPLGPLQLLYTPWAIVCGELLLALPLIISLTQGVVRSLDRSAGETAKTLGAGVFRRGITYLSEARRGITLAVIAAFSRCVTELGIAMMVGGNIKDRTRTLATATALETGKGEFARGLAMGLILFAIAGAITLVVVYLSQEERPGDD